MPVAQLRRLGKNGTERELPPTARLEPKDFILPYFVTPGKKIRKPIVSMPGVYRLSVDNLLKDIESARKVGIRALLLFGVSTSKDKTGSTAYLVDGLIQKAVAAVKKRFSRLVVITDVCLCGHTTHGHCGIIKPRSSRTGFIIDKKKTLKVLAKIALSHARAGADLVAPSAMMDGQVRVIREALDGNGFKDTGILAYSAKYASNFYWPFREALDSAPRFGDRRSYQLDYRSSDEALREIKQDIGEGADMVMIKPALSYLDIIARAKQRFNTPIAAYNVSGEYSMIKGIGRRGGVREKDLVLETLVSIKRAGADMIISYWAKEAASWLK